MRQQLITLLLAFGLLMSAVAQATDGVAFIIEPASSVKPGNISYPAPSPEMLEAAEQAAEQAKNQLQMGIIDKDEELQAQLAYQHLLLARGNQTPQQLQSVYNRIVELSREREELITTRHRAGAATDIALHTTQAQAAWAQANAVHSTNPAEYTRQLQTAQRALTALVQCCENRYRNGLAGIEEKMIADIALAEVCLALHYRSAERRQAAARAQEAYDKLAALYAARAREGMGSRKKEAEANAAAALFRRECARHISRNRSEARRAQSQLCAALTAAQEQCTRNVANGLSSVPELNAISARLAAENASLRRMAR